MKCPKCNKEVQYGEEKCEYCGVKFNYVQPSTQRVSQNSGENSTNQTKKEDGKSCLVAIVIFICIILFTKWFIGVGNNNSSSSKKSSGGSGICQFEDCTRKATSIGGNFCSYHDKALNDYWDVSGYE